MKILTRRQIHERKNKIARRKLGVLKGNKPARDAKYLAFIRTLSCCVCIRAWYLEFCCPVVKGHSVVKLEHLDHGAWGHRKSQACHMGPHGISQKASDDTAIPMCPSHHLEIGSVIEKIEAKGIDYKALVAKLKEAYETRKGKS